MLMVNTARQNAHITTVAQKPLAELTELPLVVIVMSKLQRIIVVFSATQAILENVIQLVDLLASHTEKELASALTIMLNGGDYWLSPAQNVK